MPDVAPAGNVREADTTAAAVLLLDKLTTIPPVGAGPLRETVPVDAAPPTTEVGLSVSDVTVGGLMVRVDVLETVPCVAVTVAVA